MRRAVLASLCLHGVILALLTRTPTVPESGAKVALVPVWVAGADQSVREPARLARPRQVGTAAAPPAARPRPDRGGGSRSNATARGDAVVAPRLDPRHRNEPPIYPAEAVRAGEQGTVLLRVRVAADGHAARVHVERSSGFVSLDAAARQAVAAWHFLPARKAGRNVAADMPIRVRFRL